MFPAPTVLPKLVEPEPKLCLGRKDQAGGDGGREDGISHHAVMSPIKTHSPALRFQSVAPEYWAASLSLAPNARMVTPAPATVTYPAPYCRRSMRVQMGKATLALVGMVSVIAAALLNVTSFPASDSARV